MALGLLAIIFIVLGALSLLFQILLYKGNDNTKNYSLIFMLNVFLGVVLSFLVYSSLPSNFIGEKIIAAALGLLAIFAIGVRVKIEKHSMVSKTMLTISIIGGLIQLYI